MFTEDIIADPVRRVREEYVAEYPAGHQIRSIHHGYFGKLSGTVSSIRLTDSLLAQLRAFTKKASSISLWQAGRIEEEERVNLLADHFGDIVHSPMEEYSVIMAVKGIAEEKLVNRAYQKEIWQSIAEREQQTGKVNVGYTADRADTSTQQLFKLAFGISFGRSNQFSSRHMVQDESY